MKKIILLLTLFVFTSQFVQGQRYLAEVFDDADIQVEENVVYGQNFTVLTLGVTGHTNRQPLIMDVYQPPASDTEMERPVALVLHTGNFLPTTFNGGCGGTIKDADVVELSRRLARMGYVACAIDYRLGWDPANQDQNVRVFTIINAAYRGVQDANTAVKFLKRSIAENGNPYQIKEDRIAMFGFGTGGYLTYGAATLNDVSDTWIPKFTTLAGPMVSAQINGNLDPEESTVVPPGFPGLPEGDTLCVPNHVGFNSDFQLAVQFGGACGDLSWVTPGDVPMISSHVITDPFAPCDVGIVNVPPPINLPVVEVNGACSIIPEAVNEGVNDVFNEVWIDDISEYVSGQNGNIEGFFPFYSDDPQESAPWNFAYSSEPYGVMGSDCPTDQAGAMVVMDSIMSYVAPRACLALNLDCDLSGITSTIDVLKDSDVGLTVGPNPAIDRVTFTTIDTPINDVYLFNANGKLIGMKSNINNTQYEMRQGTLTPGTYLVMLKFEEGYITKKVIFTQQ